MARKGRRVGFASFLEPPPHLLPCRQDGPSLTLPFSAPLLSRLPTVSIWSFTGHKCSTSATRVGKGGGLRWVLKLVTITFFFFNIYLNVHLLLKHYLKKTQRWVVESEARFLGVFLFF